MRALVTATALASILASCSAGDGGADAHGGDAHVIDGSLDGNNGPAEIVLIVPGAPADAASHFGTTPVSDAARAASIDYPLDRVVFPRNVTSPDIQWEGPGNAGDLYRVRIVGPNTTLTAYLAHSGAMFGYHYLVDSTAWHTLASSSGGRDTTLTVDRWDSMRNDVVAGTTVHMHFTRGSIAGAVYYWTLGSFGGTEGRIVRVMQGTDTPPTVENFLPNPPPRSDGMRCAACHGLSRDGNRLAISLGDGQLGAVFDTTQDLTGPNPTPLFQLNEPWFFAAFNPSADRVIMTDPSQNSALLDGTNGSRLTPSSGALPSMTHPAWSPDGHLVAGIVNADEAWNPTRGDIAVMDSTSGDAFSAMRVLHRGADLSSAPETGGLDAYPSFSPDSRYLAFQHGTRTLLSASGASGALYLVSAMGSTPIRLDRASNGATASDAWYPNFTPFVTPDDDTGSVYWVLFYGRRDYGNTFVGTKGTNRRQIWVTAVSTDPASHPDPSSVPYWLPGQEVQQENASAFWAPRPCRANGSSCEGDGQCCGGNCVQITSSDRVCQPPPSSNCRREGQSCSADGDCCGAGALACAGGVCLATPG